MKKLYTFCNNAVMVETSEVGNWASKFNNKLCRSSLHLGNALMAVAKSSYTDLSPATEKILVGTT